MRHTPAQSFRSRPGPAERRRHGRETLVLRVGLIEHEGRSAFCLVKNIAARGAQVRLYAPLEVGALIRLRISDEDALDGQVLWLRAGVAGIEFDDPLNPATSSWLRTRPVPLRRRIAPRLREAAAAMLRTGGRTYAVELCDISTSGARIRTRRSIEPGYSAELVLAGLPSQRVFVRWISGDEMGLVFQTPIPIQIIALWLCRK